MEYTQDMKSLIYKLRQEWLKGDNKRDEGLSTTDSSVTRLNDISYGPYGDNNILDLNLPKNHQGKIPIIINIHGGGFFYGTKETYQFYCLFLAKQGFAVVNFNYRLAPEYQFPANIEDLDKVLVWVEENADKYNLDTDNVFLVGDSAGGQEVTQYNAIYTNNAYRKLFGLRKTSLHIRAVATNCGGFITEYYKNIPETETILYAAGFFFATHQDSAKVDLTNITDNITSDFLPTYIMTSNKDFVSKQSYALDNRLNELKIEHEFHEYGDETHPREHVFHINQKDDLAKQCNLNEIKFFKKYMNK